MSLKEVYIDKIRNEFPSKKVLVIGDLMIDGYILGDVSRISPEAPVAVLSYKEKKLEAGGAANVARNLNALSCKTLVSGIAAEDEDGLWLRSYLRKKSIGTEGIFEEKGRPTTIKTRFATKEQQLLRVDNENASCIQKETEKKLFNLYKNEIPSCDAVILSDYKKGVFSNPDFVQKIISLCAKNNVFVSVDSKSHAIKAFKGADFVKPNNFELEEIVGIKIENDETLTEAGFAYLDRAKSKRLIVTRGAEGISVFEKGKCRKNYASKAISVFDVTGAGDTVISVVTLGMICGLDVGEAVQLGNLAASVVISKRGTATVSSAELMERIYEEKNL